MDQKRYYIFIVAGLILTSCDIPGRLILVNKTGKDVVFNLDSYPAGMHEGKNMQQIKMTADSSRVTFYYGFGGFSKQNLKELKESFKEVQVIEGNDTIVIKQPEKLEQMLPKRRTGLFNSKMKIKIKTAPNNGS